MLVDIVEVKSKNYFNLWLKFEDGTEGEVDIKRLLVEFTGVFSVLEDLKTFRAVRANPETGTIIWPGDIDLCQDVLYAAVKGLPKPNLDGTNVG